VPELVQAKIRLALAMCSAVATTAATKHQQLSGEQVCATEPLQNGGGLARERKGTPGPKLQERHHAEATARHAQAIFALWETACPKAGGWLSGVVTMVPGPKVRRIH